jgi:hypothetical protein
MKIVVIDDEIKQLEILSQKYRGLTFLEFSSNIRDYFEIDVTTLNVALKNSILDVEFLFVHHSINNIRLPNNFFPQIENLLGKEKIFYFSGGRETDYFKRSIKRDCFYNRFEKFVNLFIKVQQWYIPTFFQGNYENTFVKKQIHDLKSTRIDQLYNNQSYQRLILFLNIEKDLPKDYLNTTDLLNDIKKQFRIT